MPDRIPHTAHDLTPEFLSSIISKTARGTAVTGVNVVKAHEYGDGDVSTSARASLRLDYAGDLAESLPRVVVVKLSFDSRDSSKDVWFCQLHGLFNNEVNFYNRMRPMLNIEAPRSLGGLFDPDTRQYVLIMEDVSKRGATFPTMMDDVTVGQVQTVPPRVMAGRYYRSPYCGSPRHLKTTRPASWSLIHDSNVALVFGVRQINPSDRQFRRDVLAAHHNIDLLFVVIKELLGPAQRN